MVEDKIQEIYEKEIVEKTKKLTDDVYKALSKLKEFNRLSLDRQGEISVTVSNMISSG